MEVLDCGLRHLLCVRFQLSSLFPLFNERTDDSNYCRNGAQVFVVTAAGSVIAFIIRDLGNASTAGWIIQVVPFHEFNLS
jgi:hypothetical protein